MLTPGTVFAGSYRVEKPLKEGGMGAVYVATQIGTSQRCALKVMQPELVKDAEARKRFEREAKAGGQLQSDFVVKVLDARVDETTGMPWLATGLRGAYRHGSTPSITNDNLGFRCSREIP